MVEALLHRFTSKEGYAVYPDAQRLFVALRIATVRLDARYPDIFQKVRDHV